MTAMCQDPSMIKAYHEGKDLYSSIAAISFDTTYNECLEHFPKGSYIKKKNGRWYYATESDYDKIADGENDTYADGKERRSSAKSILLGILYGRGINSIAEQLHTTKDVAQKIQDKVFKGFPAIKQFEDDTLDMARELGFVTTFWGRKRRLPEMQLEEFEFAWAPGYGDVDPLSFDTEIVETEVPNNIKRKWLSQLHRSYGAKRRQIVIEAKSEGVIITDNGGKIADATRQCVNSRIQGSAADMSKLAGINIVKNKRLKELGFKLLVPIHDEYLATCPIENAKECAKIFSECMCDAAKDLNLPMKTDVEITREWYGEPLNLEEL